MKEFESKKTYLDVQIEIEWKLCFSKSDSNIGDMVSLNKLTL